MESKIGFIYYFFKSYLLTSFFDKPLNLSFHTSLQRRETLQNPALNVLAPDSFSSDGILRDLARLRADLASGLHH